MPDVRSWGAERRCAAKGSHPESTVSQAAPDHAILSGPDAHGLRNLYVIIAEENGDLTWKDWDHPMPTVIGTYLTHRLHPAVAVPYRGSARGYRRSS